MNIRKAVIEDAIGIAKVHIKAWQETYKGLICEEYLNSISLGEKTKKWKDIIQENRKAERTLVIENELRDIVGFAFYGINNEKKYEYDGDLHAIYILKAYQNCGCGSKIIKTAVKELVDLGCNSLMIWALKDNPYCRFYEKIGGIKVGERQHTYGNQEVKLAGYGWKDIRSNRLFHTV
ncbi:GNAT family N-acetyltransferase [Clostridium akagii]|uniref:GNAT family N-acetyltransferase n=1 Tax=Clostridium akagii TaxID=91623 RepID=UPI0004795237|nr:GNAT family N-acetyltransferase [Clostridium akagii]